MSLLVTTAPPAEPLSLADAKTHLRVTSTAEEDYIESLIKVARGYVESVTGRVLVERSIRWTVDDFPCGDDSVWRLPVSPVQSIESIVYTDTNGTEVTWASSNYLLHTDEDRPYIYLAFEKSWPSDVRDIRNAVKVNMIAGYADDAGSPISYTANIPSEIIHAIKLLVGHWYWRRHAASADALSEIPMGVAALLVDYKRQEF